MPEDEIAEGVPVRATTIEGTGYVGVIDSHRTVNGRETVMLVDARRYEHVGKNNRGTWSRYETGTEVGQVFLSELPQKGEYDPESTFRYVEPIGDEIKTFPHYYRHFFPREEEPREAARSSV